MLKYGQIGEVLTYSDLLTVMPDHRLARVKRAYIRQVKVTD